MATRKPRRPSAAGRKGARRTPPRPAARKRTAGRRPPARPRVAAAPKATARPAGAAAGERRRQDPQTLRLRAIEPSFTVNDLSRSIKFYRDVLGFVVGDEWREGSVLRGVMLKAGSCTLGLSQDDWSKGRDRKKGEGMRIWCQTAQDIDALAARIKRAGGRLAEEPKDQPWGARTLAVDDPDGFHITIYHED